MSKKGHRLFVADTEAGKIFFVSSSLWDALIKNQASRPPTEDDVREFVISNRISERPLSEVAAEFGVSKQAVLLWRRKAGIAKLSVESKKTKVVEALKSQQPVTPKIIRSVSNEFGVGVTTVERYAREAGIERVKIISRRRPSDKELVVLACNRTWPEFAKAAGMSLAYLRGYVYARPELARMVRGMLVRQAPKKSGEGNAE